MTQLPTRVELDRLCGVHNWRIFGVSALIYDADYAYLEIAKPKFWRTAPDGRTVLALGSIGGHLEPNESLLACLKREAIEELDIPIQVNGCPSTQLLVENRLQPRAYTDGDQPLPWFISVRPNQRPDAAGDVGHLAIVTYLAQALGQPSPQDLFGLVAIPHGRLSDALPSEPILFDQFVQATGAKVQVKDDLPAGAWVQTILTAESIRQLLASSSEGFSFCAKFRRKGGENVSGR